MKEKLYKKWKRIVALGMILVCVMSYSQIQVIAGPEHTESAFEAMMYTTTEVRACLKPDFWYVNQKSAIELQPSTLLHVTAITDNGWYRIEINGVTYYVRQSQMSVTDLPKGAPTLVDPNSPYIPFQYQVQICADSSNRENVMQGYLQAIENYSSNIVWANCDINIAERWMVSNELLVGKRETDSTYMSYAMARIFNYSDRLDLTQMRYISTIEEELAVEAIVSQMLPTYNVGTDYDKIQAVYQMIRSTATTCTDTMYGRADNRSAYDIFANGKASGQADALLFQKFMEMMRITSYIGHEGGSSDYFNVVYLDGQWYYVDCLMWKNEGLFLKGANCKYGGYLDGITISPTDYRQ